MTTIDNIRNDILNNNYDDYKKKIIKIKENNSKLNLSDKNINKLAENAKKMSYIINIINHSVNAKCINQKGFLKKITNEINKTTKLNFSTLDTYKIMNEAIKTKNEHKKLINKKEFKNNVIQMNGGFVSGYFGWDEETGFGTKALDILSLMLDLAGIVPGAGIAIDGINILINLIRGKWVMAGIGLVSVLPIIGTVGPALKIGYQMISQPENEEESEEESSDEEYE
jgi:hypothetical protein